METCLRAKSFWALLLTFVGCLLLCSFSCGRQARMPAADDAFCSYHQAACGLAQLLLHPSPPRHGENQPEQLASALADLERRQAEVSAIPADKLQRLRHAEQPLVSQSNQAWNELSRAHAKYPNFLAADWPRLEVAFSLCHQTPEH